MFDWLKVPAHRVHAAIVLFWLSLAAWLATHALMLLTSPTGFTSWTAHLLLALSWWAVTLTAVNIIVTTDVRREQEDSAD